MMQTRTALCDLGMQQTTGTSDCASLLRAVWSREVGLPRALSTPDLKCGSSASPAFSCLACKQQQPSRFKACILYQCGPDTATSRPEGASKASAQLLSTAPCYGVVGLDLNMPPCKYQLGVCNCSFCSSLHRSFSLSRKYSHDSHPSDSCGMTLHRWGNLYCTLQACYKICAERNCCFIGSCLAVVSNVQIPENSGSSSSLPNVGISGRGIVCFWSYILSCGRHVL